MKTRSVQDKVEIITLGCSKNIVDSENIVTQLRGNQINAFHESDQERGNIVVVNTCGFIDRAKEESIDTILENVSRKKSGEIDKLYVTGCLSQRYREDLEKEIPEVDAFFGTMELPALLARFDANYKHELIGERSISTLPHYAYLKISEGCNRTCSFCAIPLMRGKHVSRSIDDLVDETRQLARNGVREIMLIAQELTYYGLDIYKRRALADLLVALARMEGIEWIRLHYAYPSKFPVEVFDVMRDLPQICNYLDMPLQHAHDDVLSRMRRQITQDEMNRLIETARKKVPDIALRTTMMVGFPGESEEEFEELCSFVKDVEFERMGVFQYSHEEETHAHKFADDIPQKIKASRALQLMEIQSEISLAQNVSKIGKKCRILVDRKEGGYFIGRSEYDSPEVDNEVLIDASKYYLRPGDFAEIEITGAEEFDLYGLPVGNVQP